jgi:hypothetical protein
MRRHLLGVLQQAAVEQIDDRMTRQDARRMIVRRAKNAGLLTRLGCHTQIALTPGCRITLFWKLSGPASQHHKAQPLRAEAA